MVQITDQARGQEAERNQAHLDRLGDIINIDVLDVPYRDGQASEVAFIYLKPQVMGLFDADLNNLPSAASTITQSIETLTSQLPETVETADSMMSTVMEALTEDGHEHAALGLFWLYAGVPMVTIGERGKAFASIRMSQTDFVEQPEVNEAGNRVQTIELESGVFYVDLFDQSNTRRVQTDIGEKTDRTTDKAETAAEIETEKNPYDGLELLSPSPYLAVARIQKLLSEGGFEDDGAESEQAYLRHDLWVIRHWLSRLDPKYQEFADQHSSDEKAVSVILRNNLHLAGQHSVSDLVSRYSTEARWTLSGRDREQYTHNGRRDLESSWKMLVESRHAEHIAALQVTLNEALVEIYTDLTAEEEEGDPGHEKLETALKPIKEIEAEIKRLEALAKPPRR